MKLIPISQGKFAKVDDDDFEALSVNKWTCSHGYAVRKPKNKNIYMHRVVMNVPDDMQIDHINRDPLDNRKSNLRICTGHENRCNIGPRKDNTSGFRGVSSHRSSGKFQSKITVNGEQIYIGTFDNPEDAARAYDVAATKYHGEFAYLNFKRNNE